jgi:hypothetical protein
MQEYRPTKVTAATRNGLEALRSKVAYDGVGRLHYIPKEVLAPEKCPLCGNPLKKFQVEFSYYECPKCHYQQQEFKLDANALAVGALIGLGIAALAYLVGLYVGKSTS